MITSISSDDPLLLYTTQGIVTVYLRDWRMIAFNTTLE